MCVRCISFTLEQLEGMIEIMKPYVNTEKELFEEIMRLFEGPSANFLKNNK
jgi:hypothetical protein